jgi:hypothetical protein
VFGGSRDQLIHVNSAFQLSQIWNAIAHYLFMIHEYVCHLDFFFCPYVADNNSRDLAWGALDDVVMGGVSESTFQIDLTGGEVGGPTGVFKGLFLLETFNFLSLCFIFFEAIPVY